MHLVKTDPRKIQPQDERTFESEPVPESEEITEMADQHTFNYPVVENYAHFIQKWIQEIARSLMLQGVDMNDPATAFDVIQTVKDVTDRQIMFYLMDKAGITDISQILTDDYMNKVKSSFKVQKKVK